jgi:hypothetical protein
MPIDINVVETGTDVDPNDVSLNRGTLRSLQATLLPGAVAARDVSDMVSRILRRLTAAPENGRPAAIRHLRIYGHGVSGSQFIAGGLEPNNDQVIGVDPGGGLLSAAVLSRLAGHFAPDGFVELHGCNVGAGPAGRILIGKLATVWQVTVHSSSRVQVGSTAGAGMVTPLQHPLVSALYSHPTSRFNISTQESVSEPPETEIDNPWNNR